MLNQCLVRVWKNKTNTVAGTAFLVTKKHILTCAHVVNLACGADVNAVDQPECEFFVDFPAIPDSKIRVIILSQYWYPPTTPNESISDMAVLELLDPLPAGCQPGILFRSTNDGMRGQKLYAQGFPEDAKTEERLTDGVVTGALSNQWLQVQAEKELVGHAIQPGFSGGPVWGDAANGIIGMIAAYDTQQGVRVGFVIPTHLLIEAWPELEQLGQFFAINHPRKHHVDIPPQPQKILTAKNHSVVVGGSVSGNVTINQNQHRAAPNTPDMAELEKGYLSWLIQECLRVSRSPFSAGSDQDGLPPVTLDAIYTALLTTTPRENKRAQAEGDFLTERESPLSALELLNQQSKLVLLGGPGSGKSTFVNYVVLCLAGEVLQRSAFNLETLTAPLPNDEGEDDEQRQPWHHEALLPIKVVLRDFAASQYLPASGQEASAEHLWQFIQSELQRAAKADYADYLRQRLNQQNGKVLLLLDGLDEVSEAEQRREQMCQAIQSFVDAHRGCRVLVTCRPYAYSQAKWQLEGFVTGRLAFFSEGQIRRFIDRWYAKGNLQAADAKGRASLLKDLIFRFQGERLRELARHPLLLTMMAHLHADKNRDLPEKRDELYEQVTELLLESWEKRRYRVDASGNPVQAQPSLMEYLRIGSDKIRFALEKLAFQAHAGQAELKGTADIKHADLVSALMALAPDDENIKPKQLMNYLCDRSGMLQARMEGIYTFPHRSFQEYLAASYLNRDEAELGDFEFEDYVAELGRKTPDRWREVVLLAGLIAATRNSGPAWDLADALCPEPPTSDKPNREQAWGARLAGQLLVEATNHAAAKRNKIKIHDNVRDWQLCLMRQSDLPATERCAAGDNLAKLGDPRFDADFWYLPKEPMFGFSCVAEGDFLMGSDQQWDAMAYDDEYPQHTLHLPTYYISRFPVTVAQFRCFIEDSGYKGCDTDVLQGLDNLPVVYVSWFDAIAYCRWLQGHLVSIAKQNLQDSLTPDSRIFWQGLLKGTLQVSLASEAEWEKAARSNDGRIYPWGDEADPDKANNDETDWGRRSCVGCFPGGRSPYGCEEMSGNVWEWTRSHNGKYPYPESTTERAQREDLSSQDARRVVRGGAFSYVAYDARVAYRSGDGRPDRRGNNVGFRVVVSPFPLDSGYSER